MKQKTMPATLGFLASFAAFLTLAAAAGGSEESSPSKSIAATEGESAIVSRVDSDLRNCEFDRRDEFLAHYNARNKELTTRVARLRSVHSAALASPEENEAMEQLAAAQESFEQKLTEAASATPETWNAARDSVAASWDKLISIYSDLSEKG
jgi:hypothetical protein